MQIPHWRLLTPPELDRAIRDRLRTVRGAAVYVVERRRVEPAATTLGLAATLPEVGWNMLRTLSAPERASWLAWTWLVWALIALLQSDNVSTVRVPRVRA